MATAVLVTDSPALAEGVQRRGRAPAGAACPGEEIARASIDAKRQDHRGTTTWPSGH